MPANRKKSKVIIIDWNRELIYEGKDSRGISASERIKYKRLMEDVDREWFRKLDARRAQ